MNKLTKIIKLIQPILAVLLIICCIPCQASAESEYMRVNDMAGLMTEAETDELNKLADTMSVKYKYDITIMTVEQADVDAAAGTGENAVREYADLTYNDLDYGFGDGKDGMLFLFSAVKDDDGELVKGQSTAWISTKGFGETAFTLYGIDCIKEEISYDLGNGDFYEAFKSYIDIAEKFIVQAKTGKPYDSNNQFSLPKTVIDYVFDVAIGLVIGLVIALIILLIMKSKLKSVAREFAAKNYVTPGSLNVTASRELYLYSTRTMTEKPKDNESSGSGSHVDSSGESHGGGGWNV